MKYTDLSCAMVEEKLADLLLEASELEGLDDYKFDGGSIASGLMVQAAVRLKRTPA